MPNAEHNQGGDIMYLYPSLQSWTTVVAHTGDGDTIAENKQPAQACDISRAGLKLLLAQKFERDNGMPCPRARESGWLAAHF